MVDVALPASPAPSRAISSSFPFAHDEDGFLPITPRRQKMGIMPSPGSLESMLKTSTETGDIGFFSIAPKNYRPPTRKYDKRELSLIQAMGDENHPLITVNNSRDEPFRPYTAMTEIYRPYSRASSLASRGSARTIGPRGEYLGSPAQLRGRSTRSPMLPNGDANLHRPRSRPPLKNYTSASSTSSGSEGRYRQPSMQSGSVPPWQSPRMTSRTPVPYRNSRSPMPTAQHQPSYAPPHRRHMSAHYNGYMPQPPYHPYGYGPGPPITQMDPYGRRVMSGGPWYGPPQPMYPPNGAGPAYYPPPPTAPMMTGPGIAPYPGNPRRMTSSYMPSHVAEEPAAMYNELVDYVDHGGGMDTAKTPQPSINVEAHGMPRMPLPRQHPQPSSTPHRARREGHPPGMVPQFPQDVPHEIYSSRPYQNAPTDVTDFGHPGRYFSTESSRDPSDVDSKNTTINHRDSAVNSSGSSSPGSDSVLSAGEHDNDSVFDQVRDENSRQDDLTPTSSTSSLSATKPPVQASNNIALVSMMENGRPGSRICDSALTIRDKENMTPRPADINTNMEGQDSFRISLASPPQDIHQLHNFGPLQKKQKPVVIHDGTKPSLWTRVTNKLWRSRTISSSSLSRASSFIKF